MPKQYIFDKKNVVVLGGAGFIGSHLCDELIKDSKVICIDNFSTGQEKNIDHLLSEPNFEFIRHDITEPIDLDKMPELQKFKIEFQGIQEIYNLACPMSPRDFTKNLIATILANSYGVKNVVDLALRYSARLVHFSSSVIYGIDRKDHKIEEFETGLSEMNSERSAYDEGKKFAETMILNYQRVKDLNAVILRVFRTYGPRMKIDDGQMIPDFINCALEGRDLTIYGSGDFVSSFCYVSDCVDAALKAAAADFSGPINIGSDVEVKLLDLARMIIESVSPGLRVKYEKEMLFMKPLNIPNINLARTELDWMPVISLNDGIEKTIYELKASKGLKDVKHAVS